MKLNKKQLCHICVLLGFYALIVLLLMSFQYAYGSTTDWSSQHFAIPDYFRKLFYETGEFFPSFAPNIGAGENIYYLSYYGLYSPIILLSYMLPFIKMSTYIQAISIIGIAVDIVLFYVFIKRKFSDKTSFLLTLVFMLSDSLIFHSHRHIMFVNYMPFLLLGLMAVDDYFYKKRNIRVAVYSFLIILCSYYFSIPALIAMTVYGISCYLRTTDKFNFKDFIRCGMGFALRIVTGIMMSGVLLLPTLAAMLSGRDKTSSSVELTKLIPKVSLDFFSTNCYGMGVSCFLIAACIVGIMSKVKGRRFLSIVIAILITCPVFVYALNMGMYIDSKVLIPFVPLAVLVMGESYEDLLIGKFKAVPLFLVSLISVIVGIVTFTGHSYARIGTMIDSIVYILMLLAFLKFRKKTILILSMTGISLISMITQNFGDNKPTISYVNSINSDEINSLADEIANDDNIYRSSNLSNRVDTPNMIYNTGFYSSTIYSSLHNHLYNNFYFNEIRNENEFRNSALTTASQNVLFKILMGEKYIIANDEVPPTGYEKIRTIGKSTLYKNDNVMPLGYSSNKVLSQNSYEKLNYPENVEALAKYIIVPENASEEFKSDLQKIENLAFEKNDDIVQNNGEYSVDSNKKIRSIIKLNKPLKKDEVLLLKFNVDNSQKRDKNDAKVIINGIKNTLTTPNWKYFNHNNSFEYVITTGGKEHIDSLEIKLFKGKYKISDIEGYVMKYPKTISDIDKFVIDKNKTKGDFIEGNINCKNDGYFQLSVPYDKGFEITVDGKTQAYTTTDTSFIGFPITKGQHYIKIKFVAPFLNVGKMLSLAGFVLLVIVGMIELVRKKEVNI